MNDSNVRKLAEKCNIHPQFKGSVLFDEPMSRHTTFKTGGPAPLFIEPLDRVSLEIAANILKQARTPFFILGGGSNIVVSDRGFGCPVVSVTAVSDIACQKLSEREYIAECGAGTPSSAFVNFCISHGLGNMESFAGLPGTVGGAVYMNARCYGVSVSGCLHTVSYMDLADTVEDGPHPLTYTYDPKDWDYKLSPFQSGKKLILSASFKLPALTDEGKCKAQIRAEGCIADRTGKGHFAYPSAGSVFKNNRSFGKPSGKIIDEAGLRGYAVGGAQIAPWHGNFIINTGRATSQDIRDLADFIISEVYKKTGFTLEPEIIFCGKTEDQD